MRLAAALALLAACGIKGPPRPPLPEPVDGGAPRAAVSTYTPGPPVIEADAVRLVWRSSTRFPGRVAVEEHLLHGGAEGPRCGHRRILALLPASAEVAFRAPRRAGPARYRLLDETGAPLSTPVAVGR